MITTMTGFIHEISAVQCQDFAQTKRADVILEWSWEPRLAQTFAWRCKYFCGKQSFWNSYSKILAQKCLGDERWNMQEICLGTWFLVLKVFGGLLEGSWGVIRRSQGQPKHYLTCNLGIFCCDLQYDIYDITSSLAGILFPIWQACLYTKPGLVSCSNINRDLLQPV